MKNYKLFFLVLLFFPGCIFALPKGFVYLKDIDPSIIQEMRYAGWHNFMGKPVKGYERATCILAEPAAMALKNIQAQLKSQGLSLKVYDCYRPTMAVRDFVYWSQKSPDQEMKNEFFPRTPKQKLFELGYIAKFSGHSRGSTIDLTLVDLSKLAPKTYDRNQKLVSCYAPWSKRFRDNSIDMGSGFDCLDRVANINNREISEIAQKDRAFLQGLMTKNGFQPYDKEWWHFTLKNEPYPNRYFNFPVK